MVRGRLRQLEALFNRLSGIVPVVRRHHASGCKRHRTLSTCSKNKIDLAALHRLRAVSRFEFRVAMVALAGVLLLGILKGVLLAAIVSLLMLIAAAVRPNIAFLGRIPGSRRYSDIERHPDNENIPGALIFRVESSILYFNTDYVRPGGGGAYSVLAALAARCVRPFQFALRRCRRCACCRACSKTLSRVASSSALQNACTGTRLVASRGTGRSALAISAVICQWVR